MMRNTIDSKTPAHFVAVFNEPGDFDTFGEFMKEGSGIRLIRASKETCGEIRYDINRATMRILPHRPFFTCQTSHDYVCYRVIQAFDSYLPSNTNHFMQSPVTLR